MRKVLSSLLVAMLLPAVALGESLSAAPTDELVALRTAVNQEIASRVDAEDAQTIAVDGVIFRLKLVEVGTARDDHRGLGIILLANNPTDASMTPLYDLGVTVTQGGKPLEITLSRKHTRTGEDPYCGTFSVDIADIFAAS